MKLGYFGIGSGPCADPDVAARAAQTAEAAGLESLWTGEHVVLPDPRVPPSPVSPRFPMLDPTAVLSFLAGITERVKLGSGIIILPQRNPLVLAKELGSLDVLSKGRLLVGIGVGYLRPEFEALGVSFERKGPRTDESIDAMRALWIQEKPAFQGEFLAFEGIDAHPRPSQQPPPIVIGGHSQGAFRRAVERGNGWYGFALDVPAAARCIQGLRQAEARYSRPTELGPLELSVTPAVPLDADLVRSYEDLGIHRLIPMTPARSGDDVVAFIEKTSELASAP